MGLIIMLYIVILLFFTGALRSDVISSPSVTISIGKFTGENLKTYNNVSYLSFKGIKFANVFKRFTEAIPVDDSNESFNATNFGPICNQLKDGKAVGTDDCLYLNVFTPGLNGSLPVIVYIYGGSFRDGSCDLYSPDYFMASSKVVVVTISYRVNAFGFLYFDDPKYPANLGIRDQILGLQWIKKYIKNFGGDPNRVTITGQSAGAASVSILMNSIPAKGLFVGAISESGTACTLWAVQPRCTGIHKLRLLAEKLHCQDSLPKNGGSADNVVKCLRNKTSEEILMGINDFMIFEKFVPFPPIKEPDYAKNPVISIYPWESDKKASLDLVPWITGMNSNEARTLLPGEIPTSKLEVIGLQVITPLFLPKLFYYENTASDPLNVSERILLKNAELYLVNFQGFLEKTVTESNFMAPMVQCMKQSKAPSYGYYFNYYSSVELGKINGVGHSGELQYLWPPPSSSEIRLRGSKRDMEISDFLVNTWITFAYDQSANSSSQKWDIFDSNLDNILIIDNKGIKMGKNPNQKAIDFWQSLNLSSQPKDKNCNQLSL